MQIRPLQKLIAEPWLAFNRLLTVNALKYKVRGYVRPKTYEPLPGSLLYVAASALPYLTTGYTTRTHELLLALSSQGARVHALTRPGYPWDRKDRQLDADGTQTVVDGIEYQHALAPRNNRPVLQYAVQAAPVIAEVAKRHRVSVIHAASNHVNALPALLAARRLGIPFQYEMRGLWELSRASRQPGFDGSQAYKQGLALEGLVACEADKLFVISDQLGKYARQRWGVDGDKIFLLPNCVDPERLNPVDPEYVSANTIGYAGALIGYEGLDTLIDAVALLAQAGNGVRVTIIGDGEARLALEAQVSRLGLGDRIRFLGKMPPDMARATLARCSLVCIPRKPFAVCEIVTPIKLVEAMAMGKPVIVPDLPVFRDEMADNNAGWFFKAGDAADLAAVIEQAFADKEKLAAAGACARGYATTKRRWQDFVGNLLPGTAHKMEQ